MESLTVKSELVIRNGERYLVALMPSGSNPSHFYRTDITNGRCNCPAWKFSRAGADGKRPPCKHLRALGYTESGDSEDYPVSATPTKVKESTPPVPVTGWFSSLL